MNWEWPTTGSSTTKLVSSLIVIATVVIVRTLLVRLVVRTEHQFPEARRRWIVNIRNASIFVLFVTLLGIWNEQLRTLVVSFIALAVAMVIATKELILCLSGAIVRAASKSYSIGDRIEIAGKRGDVVDQDLFTTTLQEIGPGTASHQYTGRAIVLPNSLLLTHPVINETYTHDYSMHVFTIPLQVGEDWHSAEKILLAAARAECEPFIEEARLHMKHLEKRHLMDSPTVEPRVTLQIPEAGKINLLLRIPVPSRRKGRLEQAILRRFLSEFPRLSH
ncbi:MAG: mechanosensitive ion channel [Terriglobia bacterium]